ncbi:UDP-glucosyltransferase 2-like [Schistocerca americana]|uniref:UDP-glucosyltransferase 2-like n=1 Tax=Schistocerca americana TaxID=7009 RepID=UPI001F5000AC|nr:UDP-glucosyltransferase 2-like [Schistocerca americana]
MKARFETSAVALAVWAAAAWCCGWLPAARGANILAVFPMEGRSHWIVNRELLVELARRGHNLTVLTPFHEPGDPWELVKPTAQLAGSTKFDFLGYGSLSTFTQFVILFHMGTDFCQRLMDDPVVRELIDSQERTYDLLIMETFFHDCFFAFSHKYRAPTVLACAFGGGNTWINYAVGNPYPLSYLPEGGVAYTTRMSLFQKTYNSLLSLALNLYRDLVYFPALDEIVRKAFGDPSMPPLAEMERNMSLLLLNNHFSFDYARPLVPNAVQVAGMHIKPPKALPKDLQEFMDAATEGVVYFSMGSNIKSADLSEELRAVFLKTFAKLKQKVLWKFEDDSLPNQPPNLRISKWFPQSDLLVHRNVRLFVTHGGMMSLQEALYAGVPLLGFPIFGDQEANLVRARDAGFGLLLHINNITEQSLGWALDQLLGDPRYAERARQCSRLFHDRPEPPLQLAARSVEYVLRHGGARHMRSAALDLPWYRLLLLDVAAFLLLCAAAAALAAALAVRFLVRKLSGTAGAAPVRGKKTEKKD